MKKLCIYILLGISIGYSQSNTINSPSLVASSGGNWTQGDYNFCFSLGEIAIDTYIQDNIILTQGFHQENNSVTIGINKATENHSIQLYPNPTENILNINCNLDESISFIIQDVQGRTLLSFESVSGNSTHIIDIGSLSQGVYFLELFSESIKKQVYQIQKLN